MFYRENGQFKTSYLKDQQIFPIAQDRWAIGLLLAAAFIGVPLLADEYMFRAILIPFVILSMAALGVNILVGYCGQISLGSGAFMAVGAYMAYNTFVRIEGMPLIIALLSGGFCAMLVGVFFGIPSLRVKGLYLAVATLAAQFFCDWAFARISWFTNDSSSGSVAVSGLSLLGWKIDEPFEKYLFCLGLTVITALLAKNLLRSAIGREWMAIRDMDVAAAVIGIRPVGLCASGLLGARGVFDRSLLPVAVHRHHRRAGLHHGQLFWRRLHRGAAHRAQPGAARPGRSGRADCIDGHDLARRIHDLRRAHRLVPYCRAAWAGQAVEHRQAKTQTLAVPALIFTKGCGRLTPRPQAS